MKDRRGWAIGRHIFYCRVLVSITNLITKGAIINKSHDKFKKKIAGRRTDVRGAFESVVALLRRERAEQKEDVRKRRERNELRRWDRVGGGGRGGGVMGRHLVTRRVDITSQPTPQNTQFM